MTTTLRRVGAVAALSVCAGLFGASGAAIAGAATAGKVTVTRAVMPVPTNPTTVAVYMTIHNGTAHAVSVVGASTPASIAGVAMPMKEVLHGQTETMVSVPRITIAAGRSFTLAPGNYHVMLEQLKESLPQGTKVPLTLRLSNGQSVAVTVTVVPLSAVFGKGAVAPSKGTGSGAADTGGMSGMKGMG